MKICPGCRRELSKNNFHKNRSQADGLAIYCKFCRQRKSKRYTKSHIGNLDSYEHEISDFGVGDRELDIKLIKGHRYQVPVIHGKYGKDERKFTGRLIQETKDLIILKHKRGFCECFRKIDFLIGEYQIKEV